MRGWQLNGGGGGGEGHRSRASINAPLTDVQRSKAKVIALCNYGLFCTLQGAPFQK